MENRRGDDAGRREEDRRWLKVQEQVMNLVTTQRTNQQELATLEVEVVRLSDHVEDLDDHLRGVAGKESLDVRVTLLEKEFDMHGVLLRRISDQFTGLHKLIEELRTDVSTFKIKREIGKESEATRVERLKTWLGFWGPTTALVFGLIVPLATLAFQHWDKIQQLFRKDARPPVVQMQQAVEAEKKSSRAKVVKKKLEAIEKTREALE